MSGWRILPLLLVVALQTFAAEPPPLRPFEADYLLSIDGLPMANLTITLTWPEAGRYSYRAATRPWGPLSWFRSDEVDESSQGDLLEQRIRPRHYLYRHRHQSGERRLEVEFDWEQNRITTRGGGSSWRQSAPSGSQDKLSQQLTLRLGLLRGEREIALPVADGGRLKQYRYHLSGESELETLLGWLAVVRVELEKELTPGRDRIWLAPALNYLPVRIDRQRRGEDYRLELQQVKWLDEREENSASPAIQGQVK